MHRCVYHVHIYGACMYENVCAHMYKGLKLTVSQSVSPCYLGKSHVLNLWPPGSLVSASQVLGSHIGNTCLPSFYVGSGYPILVHMLAGKYLINYTTPAPNIFKI